LGLLLFELAKVDPPIIEADGIAKRLDDEL